MPHLLFTYPLFGLITEVTAGSVEDRVLFTLQSVEGCGSKFCFYARLLQAVFHTALLSVML